LSLATPAGYKVVGVSNGHRGPEIEADPLMIAGRAGNLSQSKGYIRLCLQIKIHVGVDRKGVEALPADAPPFPVGPHEPFIETEARLFTDGTLNRVEAPFHFLLS
jgi:hypothetical protein